MAPSYLESAQFSYQIDKDNNWCHSRTFKGDYWDLLVIRLLFDILFWFSYWNGVSGVWNLIVSSFQIFSFLNQNSSELKMCTFQFADHGTLPDQFRLISISVWNKYMVMNLLTYLLVNCQFCPVVKPTRYILDCLQTTSWLIFVKADYRNYGYL